MEQQQPGHHHSGHRHEALIQTLLDCAKACEQCAAACLDESDVTPMAHCIELDRDCAEICFLGAKLLLRDSELAHKFLVICEEACRKCAEECGMHDMTIASVALRLAEDANRLAMSTTATCSYRKGKKPLAIRREASEQSMQLPV